MILALLLSLAAPQQGKLVVLVVVDQLRYQDLLWLAPEFGAQGFAGLGQPQQLRYETVVTETAADHAVLGTGAYADLNGVIGNRFWDGGMGREAVADAKCPEWSAPHTGKSAGALRAPTVGDALKLGTDGAGRVVTVAFKDRAALFLGGPSADLALWWEAESGELTSTSCYAPVPPAWLPKDLAAPYRDWTWTPLHPDALARLVPEERAPGALPHYDLGPQFPHPVGHGALDAKLFLALRNTPANTSITLAAARATVQALKLGESGRTDFLAIGLSAVDAVGHMYGSLARERVDTVLRIHEELGAFLAALRKQLGPRLSIVLTADHGVTPTEADEKRLHVTQGGTIAIEPLTERVDRAISEELGPRKWVESIDAAQLFLQPPYPPRAVALAIEALRREPGFFRVVPTDGSEPLRPEEEHAIARGRSGQVLLVNRPLWTLKKTADGADHGSPWNDDALVPVLLSAPSFRFRPEPRFRATQIAPSLSLLLGAAPPAAALDVPLLEPR